MGKKKDDEDTLTHINGSEVASIGEPDDNGKRTVSCKDGGQYVWHTKTGAVYPAGHPANR